MGIVLYFVLCNASDSPTQGPRPVGPDRPALRMHRHLKEVQKSKKLHYVSQLSRSWKCRLNTSSCSWQSCSFRHPSAPISSHQSHHWYALRLHLRNLHFGRSLQLLLSPRWELFQIMGRFFEQKKEEGLLQHYKRTV